MAKGNMFLSQARGKVGSVVFSVVRGQQTERVYNAKPANPRTISQQAQRALLANMTKFYKRGAQNFFKFAFEDKTIRESDFNAFARHNNQQGVFMPKELYDHPGTPALGKYIVTDGSIKTNIKDYFSGENYGLVLNTQNVVATVGSLSSLLIAENPQVVAGDIFTMVLADSDFGAEMQSAGTAPTWQIIQFYIDPSDLRALSAVGLTDFGLAGATGGRFIGVQINGVDRASFGATIISRNTESGLKVTKTELKGSATANVLYDWLRGEYMRRQAAISWGGNPEAVLQGGEIIKLPEVETVLIGDTTQPGYSYGEKNIVPEIQGGIISIVLTGNNLRTTAQGGVYQMSIYDAKVLSDGLVTNPVAIVPLTATAQGSSIQLNGLNSTNVPVGQGYYLLAVDGVPVAYGLYIRTE